MTSVEITIHQLDCCGSKMCENIAPLAFVLLSDGYAAVRDEANQCPFDLLKKAARACPTQCIVLSENGTEIDLY